MVRFSVDKLASQGFTGVKSFRAGGWMTDEKVMKALAKEGIIYESSPIPWKKVAALYTDTTLVDHTKSLWGKITLKSQPFVQQNHHDQIILVPNNLGLADYVDQREFLHSLRQNLELANKTGRNVHIVYGFHFETAAKYLHRVDQAIQVLSKLAKQGEFRLKPSTFQGVKKRQLLFNTQSGKRNCLNLKMIKGN